MTVAVGAGGDPRRAVALRNAVALLLDTGALPLRHHRPTTGRVTLVGGGPGDPGLITTRGRRALAEADVVVVDRLAPRALLAELDPAVEVVEAGKSPHAHTLTQDRDQRACSSSARGPATASCGSRAATRSCSAAAARRSWPACGAGVPVEVVPGRHQRHRGRRPPPASP